MSSNVQSNYQWGMEISLDVEWAHAIAPNAKILLVEANSASLSDLLSAVSYATSRTDVVAVSMSWGSTEFSGEQAYDSYFTSNYGATFFVSAGDTGGVVTWPSSSGNVISVGGTTLTQTTSGYTETAWSGSGGGVSAYEQVPQYQASVDSSLGYNYRATPDVSYNADPNTGFLVLNTYIFNGWYAVGGTSPGAPQWAAIQSLGESATNTNFYSTFPSSYGTSFTDILTGTSGSNQATQGYDLCTGIGSPLGTNFGTPPAPDFAISVSPNSLQINVGSSKTTTVTLTSIAGFNLPITISSRSSWVSQQTSPVTSPYAPITLTISVPTGTAQGTYPIAITGTSSSNIQHSTTINVQVTNPDFSLTANPTSLNIRHGNSGTTRITVNSIQNYAGSPTLSAKAPTSITVSFRTNPVKAGSYSTMTIKVGSTTARGPYTISVTGTDSPSSLSHTINVNVNVQ
jgi:subtilase family serine protease